MSPQLKSNISSWTSRTIKTYFSFNVIFFIPKDEISNNVKVFLFLFYYFFYKKILVPQVPQVPQVPEVLLVPEVPRSADPQFSNTRYNELSFPCPLVLRYIEIPQSSIAEPK